MSGLGITPASALTIMQCKKLRFVSAGVLLGALLMTSSMSAKGGINSWTSNGREGGRIVTLASDLVTPAALSAGTYLGGVFKSIDVGGSWSAANTGLPNLNVFSLAI